MKIQGNFALGAAIATAAALLNPMTVSAAQPPKPVRVASAWTQKPALTARAVRQLPGTSGYVTLDFVGADINDVLKALAMQSRANIVSGNDVKGTITVSLSQVTLKEALELITKLSGYQYAMVGRTYVIGTPTSIGALTAKSGVAGPTVTDVIRFLNSDPAELKKNVEAHYPNCMVITGSHTLGTKTTSTSVAATGAATNSDGISTPDVAVSSPGKSAANSNKNETVTNHGTGGVLTVTGTELDVEAVRKFVKQVDHELSGESADAKTEVLSFSYSDPDALEPAIMARFPDIKMTPGKAGAGQGTGGVLIVTATESQIAFIRNLIAQSDEALSRGIAGSKTQVYKIKYASADDLILVLARLVPSVITTPGPSGGFNLKAPTTADAGGSTSSTASYGAAGAAGAGASATTAVLKPTTYTLLLTGPDQDIARALDILAQVDVKPLQITYEAKITEINLNSAKNLGINWDFSGFKMNIGELLPLGSKSTDTDLPVSYPGQIFKFGTVGRTPVLNMASVTLDALFKNGDAKLLSNPNIAAIDGQPAAVFIGDAIRYVASITQTATGQSVTTDTVNVGIKLFVTGKASNDGYITVNIHPEVSTITGYLAVPGGGSLPQVSSREATTTVRVKDGDTLAIGGLISETDIKNVRKVPFFGDLPFFGNLFRDTSHTHGRNEVVIFVKVSIQKDAI